MLFLGQGFSCTLFPQVASFSNQKIEKSFWVWFFSSLAVPSFLMILYFFLPTTAGAWIHFFEHKTFDIQFTQFSRPIQPDPSVVIVAINDVSLKEMEPELGRWPWSRRTMGEIVQYLNQLGVRTVGIDVLYPEHNLNDPTGDDFFVAQVREAKNVILAADFPGHGPALFPFPDLLQAARDIGGIHLSEDPDGTTRRYQLWYHWQEKVYPGFSWAVASQFVGESVLKNQMPSFIQEAMPLNWYGPNGAFRYVDVSKLLKARTQFLANDENQKLHQAAAALFKDKIVLIGVTGAGLFDLRVTTFSSVYPGVEVNATAVSNLLRAHFIRPVPSALVIIYVFVLSAITALLLSRIKSSLWDFLAALLLLLCVFAIGALSFHFLSLAFPMALPLLCVFFVSAGNMIWNYFTEGREKRFIRNAFSKYMNEEVLKELLKDPKNLELGGENKELTILFSDIRGFTAFSEKLRPDEVVSLLNEYLTSMVDIVFEYGGTLDKFIGDAVMAFWGAPLKTCDHARSAVQAALAMTRKVSELRAKWKAEGRPELRIGIGINTGVVTVGNIGSVRSQSYTVIGDEVNLASRLESLNKEFHTELIVSESSYLRLPEKERERFCDLGEVKVKGKEKAVRIYGVQ